MPSFFRDDHDVTGESDMAGRLEGVKIAILATDGFEESELTVPQKELVHQGALVEVVSPKPGKIQGYRHQDKGATVRVDRPLDQAKADDYAALMLPGGVINPDALRLEPKAIDFVRGFVKGGKPIAAICHGPWTLINAEGVRGRRMTSWPSLEVDLKNAGADWIDQEVVVDKGLVTSRKPEDLPMFCRKMVEEFAEGAHKHRAA
jgi:protease I